VAVVCAKSDHSLLEQGILKVVFHIESMDVFELNCPSKRSEQMMRPDLYVRTMVDSHDNRKVPFFFMIWMVETCSCTYIRAPTNLLKMFVKDFKDVI